MNYAAHALNRIVKSTQKPTSARYTLEGYLTYLDAADALGDLLEASTITPRQRPAVDKRQGMWWITLEGTSDA